MLLILFSVKRIYAYFPHNSENVIQLQINKTKYIFKSIGLIKKTLVQIA